MKKNKYTLRYLPLFESDLLAAVEYITEKLKNPAAAVSLVEETEKAILERLDMPDIYEPYHSAVKRDNVYYFIRVKNYYVFYVLIDNVMEVRRFIYVKRNVENLIH